MILSLENVSFKYAYEKIIDDVSFVVNEKDKWGIVGLNGSGKSTLLKLMAEVERPDSGKINILRKFKISYCPQDMAFENGKSIYETVASMVTDISEGFEIKTILSRLGLIEYERLVDNLSGGQRKRLALAIALIRKADLYLLDEPTNHLDQEMIIWLEKYLKNSSSAIVMVTHDRYFLSRITDHMLEIDNGKLYAYEGNYSDFLEKRQLRYDLEKAMEQKRQNYLRNEIEWIRRGAQARTTKQKSRIQRYEKTLEINGPKEKETLQLKSATSRLGRKVIEINNLSMSFADKRLFANFSYHVLRDDRIGIIGDNGCGKTTLLKIIMKEIQPDSGYVDIGETVRIGYFAQNNAIFDKNQRVIDYLKSFGEIVYTADNEPITASSMLERFLFPKDKQYLPIAKCSGGERRRLYLCSILMMAPNVLLLDEPTNDLDTDTLTVLEEYLDDFKGAVIAISHDRYFVDKICDHLFVFENGGISLYNGNYSTYLNREKEEKKEEAKREDPRKKNKRKGLSYLEKIEYQKLEEEIVTLEEEIKTLETELGRQSSYIEMEGIGKILDAKRELLDKKNDRFFELMAKEEE